MQRLTQKRRLVACTLEFGGGLPRAPEVFGPRRNGAAYV